MSDSLDFSHRVQEIPAGAKLPEPYQRSVTAEVHQTPDIQGAVEKYAADTNWMSSIGASVAQKASSAIAARLGSEIGKNPQGEIGPAFTEFDKEMQESYQTQAQATLGLQAQKLITQSNLELASVPRLSPELITKSQQKIYQGLQKIYSFAPNAVKRNLEQEYGSVMLNQNQHLVNRMIGEQREDQKQNTMLSSKVNASNAYASGMRGDDKTGSSIIESTEKLNSSAKNMKVIDPITAKENTDTVRQSYKTGKLIHDYEKERAAGKGEAFLKSVADKSDKGDPDYQTTTNGLMQYINHQDALRSEDQQLRLSQFNTAIALNPTTPDIVNQLNDLRNNVSPAAYQKAELAYIQARKAWENDSNSQQDLIHNWGDSSVQARSSEKLQNKTFDTLVGNAVTKKGLSRDEAEVQEALSAGAPVPVFIKSLNDKATSGNPVSIVSAATQIQHLRDAEGGHALIGLSKQAQAIALQFQHQRGSMQDSDLARKITDNVMNIDSSMQATLDNAWNLTLSKNGAGGLGTNKSLATFALNAVGISENNFGGDYFKTIYGNDVYEQLKSNFDTTRGDYASALQMTKDYVNQKYGDTRVNGGIQKTDMPIEKALGYTDPDAVPFIQRDLLTQLNSTFEANKDANDYWSVNPVTTEISGPRGTFRKTFEPAQIIRHVKTDKGEKTYRYPVNLIGRPGGEWDVVVQTPTGPRNLFLVAPKLGVITYRPNSKAIAENYNAHIKSKGWFT